MIQTSELHMPDSISMLCKEEDWQWTSQGIPTSQAIEETEELCARMIAHSQVSDESIPYSLKWQHYGMGHLNLNIFQGTPHRVAFSSQCFGQERNAGFDILLMQSGAAQATHGTKTSDVAPGSLILLGSSAQWDLSFPSDQHCLSAHIELSWLKRWLPDPSDWMGRIVDSNAQWAAPLISMMNTIATVGLENAPIPRSILAEQMASLLAIALGRPLDESLDHASELMKRIRATIYNSFDRSDLSAQQVADDLGISRRHLDKVLASASTTFLTLLENQRLDVARRRLADNQNSLQIAEIAWSCGFTDPGYFSRRFRRVFGITPTCFRNQGNQRLKNG